MLKLLPRDARGHAELFDVLLPVRRQVCAPGRVCQFGVYCCHVRALAVAINYSARLKFNSVLRHFSVFISIKICRNSYSNLAESFKRVKVRLISLELSQSQ